MFSDPIKIGIIGSGYISDYHINVIKNTKNIEICGIYSKTLNNAKIKAKKYGINYFTNNLSEFTNKFEYDGILILVSADQIYKLTSKLIRHKIPLFIEKPAGLNLIELNKLNLLYKKFKTPNMIGLNRRYYSSFCKVHSLLKGKNKLRSFLVEGHENYWKIKKIVRSKKTLANWHIANNIHIIDLINFFVESKLKSVKHFNNKNGLYNNINSILKFDNGINGTYLSNWNSPERYSIKLFTDENTYVFKPLEKCIVVNKKFQKKEIKLSKFDLKYKPGFYFQFQNFVNLIKTNKNSWPDSNLQSVQKTYKIISEIYS